MTTKPLYPDRRPLRESAPPWLISLLLHLALLMVLAAIGWTITRRPEPPVLLEIGVGGGSGGSPVGAGVGDGEGTDEAGSSAQGARETAMTNEAAVPQLGVTADPAELMPDSAAHAQLNAPGQYSQNDPALSLLKGLAGLGGERMDSGTGRGPGGGGGGLGGTGGGFQRLVRQMQRTGLDVVLILDATNSMAPYIEQSKQRLRQVIGVITGLVGADETGRKKNSVRFGIVAFKDYGDDYGLDATKSLPLTAEIDKVRSFLDGITAGGGGDEPEPTHEALRAAQDKAMGWRPGRRAVMILVTDAPVHSLSREEALTRARDFAQKLHGAINVIDVGGVGQGSPRGTVLEDLAQIARAGNGSAFLLRDEQSFWRRLVVSVFGQQFEQDVQTIVERYAREP